MQHPTSVELSQQEHALSSGDLNHAESNSGSQTLLPPPFSVTASGEQESSGQAPEQSPTSEQAQTSESGTLQTTSENVSEPQTMAPPPFSVTATSLEESDGAEEELFDQEGEVSADQFADGTDEDDDQPEDNPAPNSNPTQLQTLPEPGGVSAGSRVASGKGETTSDAGSLGIVPALILLGEQLDIDVSHVENTTTVELNLTIFPGCVARRIEVIIEEGAFVSGTLYLECSYLSGIDLILNIDDEGNVSADISLEHEFLGFPTSAQAQVTEEGFAGTIDVQIPAGHSIVAGLKTTGGLLHFDFGSEEAKLQGNLQVATDDGLATGSAEVSVDLQSSEWSGTAQMQSQPRNLPIASGVDILLPDGFEFSAQFGGEEGLTMEGATTLVPQVTLQSADGMEAGGTAELEVILGPDGLEFVLKKVRLAVTGGLNAPEMADVLGAPHLTSDVDAGALLTFWFEGNSLSKIDLEVTGGINTADRRVGRLSFAGQAELNPFHFLGMLHAVTNASFKLVEGSRYTTSVMPGSQMFVSLDNAGISNVDASLGLEVADQDSALAQLRVAAALPRGQGLSLAAKLDLMRRLDISTVEEHGFGVAILPTTELGATLTDGELTGIQGALAMEVADQEGDLLAGSLDGQMTVTDSGLTLQDGSASAQLMRDLGMDLGAGEVRILEGATVSVVIEGGQLVSIGGQIEAVYDDGTSEVSISAEIDYDPNQKILRSLDADLTTDASYSLFGGKLVVSELSGGITIRNNEVVALGGHARLDAFIGDFTMAGEADVTWTGGGEESSFVGSGWLEFSWFEEEDADRYLNGRIDATIDGELFSLLGTVEMGLMPGLSGQATVAMDQEMDPVISASLSYNTVLMEANELWATELELGIAIPLVPGLVQLNAGILFGMSIDTRPLMVFGTVGVENWRPKSNEFPDFFAELRASWGLDIEAKAMAYLELVLGVDGLLHLTGGIRAGVGLSLPIELAPYISLHGGSDGVWGEMGLDLSINPVLKLLIEAYLKWGVLGLWDGEKVWSLLDQELAELGDINWSGSFAFGDHQEPSGEGPAVESQEVAPEGSPIATPEGVGPGSSLGFGNHENEPESEAGMTGLTDGLELPSSENQEGMVDQGGLGSEFAKVGEYAEGVAAVADLIKILADGFQSFIKGGPVGLLIWLLFKKPSKDEINEKRDRVEHFRQQLMDENLIEEGSTVSNMLGILSGSYSIWIIFDKSKPYRDMVDQGKHEEAILEDRAKILEGMIKGWTGEKDESRIIKVLDYTLSNEGGAGVRELTEYVGGPKRVRDQYESFLGQDSNDRANLDRIFTAAYGHNWGDNPDVSDRPTYTAVEGATVKRTGRSWEELAEEAFGHASYSVYLLNFPFNQGQLTSEQAYQDYQNNNNNNNNNGGGIPDPDDYEDGMFDPGNNNNTYNGPAYPSYLAKIPTKAEIVSMHENGVWQDRFPVPGVIEHAHWFENYHMIALFAYGDAGYEDALKAHNPTVKEVLEGVSITLPAVEELGPPWIEVAPISVGSTGYQVWVSSDDNRNPEMWMGSPDRLVTELAQEAMQFEDGQTAGEELMKAATFTDETTQLDAENALTVAENLMDFILTSNFGGEIAGTVWESANPGDTVKLKPEEVGPAAEAVYGHAGRAAWIIAFNENRGSSAESASKSSKNGLQMMEAAPTSGLDGSRNYLLPTWSEMNALDPLPAAARGVAPKSIVEVVDGDTWSTLAQKAYGDWELAVKLADFDANSGLTLDSGTIVTLPARGDLNTLVVAVGQTVAVGPVTGDDPVNTGTTTFDPKEGLTAVSHTNTSDSFTEVDDREFTPGSNLIVKAGDTWSAIALATYDDFSLFVRLSNHPLNVAFKTLPDGAEIYLPTLSELNDVPEFGLGLSPTGFPLMTEMVRVPTFDELHHVWVEDRSGEGDDPEGVWMMASTPFMLEPASGDWVVDSIGNGAVHPAAQAVHDAAKQGEDSIDQVNDMPEHLKKVVEADFLEGEGNENSGSQVLYLVDVPEDKDPQGIMMTKEDGGEQILIPNESLVKILEEDVNGKCKIEVDSSCDIGFISKEDRENYLTMSITLDEILVGVITTPVDLASGTFKVPDGEDELFIEQGGVGGVTVPVKVGNFATGEMQIMRDENGFQSVNQENAFLPVNLGLLGDVLGDTFSVGVKARIENDAVVGEAICKVGEQEVTSDNLSTIFSELGIPGITLGDSFANASFINGFYENDFYVKFLNIPIVTGNGFSGSLDIGFENGVPTITGRAIIQVSPSVTGVVELEYGDGGLSGNGTIEFVQGPVAGNLEVNIGNGTAYVDGTGTVSTDGFNGTARILYGRKSYVDSVIAPRLAALSAGQQVEPLEGGYEPDAGSGEWVLAGYVEGTMPLSDSFDATATGIMDSTGGLTLGIDIGNSDEIPLTQGFGDNYKLEVDVPVFTWGPPNIGNITVHVGFFLELGYSVGELLLKEASASGVYSDSNHPDAPQQDSLSLAGKVGIDTNLSIGGGVTVGGTVDILGNEATAEIGAKLSANLHAQANLEAAVDIVSGAEGITPNFQASGDISAGLDLGFQGFFHAEFDPWGNWADDEWTHYFADLTFPIGTMQLGMVYDPTEEPPFVFHGPEDGNIIEVNSLRDILQGMLDEHEEETGAVEGFETPTQDNSNADDGPLSEVSEDAIIGVKAVYQNDKGEIHTLKFEEHNDLLEIWRHSTPMRLDEYCDYLIDVHTEAGNGGKVNELNDIKTYLAGEEWAETMKNTMSTPDLRKIALKEVQELASQLRNLDESMGPIPSNPDGPHVVGGGRPTKSTVDILHPKQGNQGELSHKFKAKPNATLASDSMSVAWNWIEENALTGTWIKFHIINDNLGGKANETNLIATTRTDNTDYLNRFERSLKEFYLDNKVVWMEAEIDYYDSAYFPGDVPNGIREAFPKSYKAKGGTMTYKDGAWKRVDSIPEYNISPDLPSLPGASDFFEVNSAAAYSDVNLGKYQIWRSNGLKLKEYLDAGGTFTNDFDEFKEEIFGSNDFSYVNFPSFDLDDLPEKNGGLLTFLKVNSRSIKRTLKHFMNMLDKDNIKF